MQRSHRERAIDIAKEPLIREPEVVVPGVLREPRHLREPVGRVVREEEEARPHGSISSDQIEVVYDRSRYLE